MRSRRAEGGLSRTVGNGIFARRRGTGVSGTTGGEGGGGLVWGRDAGVGYAEGSCEGDVECSFVFSGCDADLWGED